MVKSAKSVFVCCVLFMVLQGIFFILAQTLQFYRPVLYLEYFIVAVAFYCQKKLLLSWWHHLFFALQVGAF